MSELTFLFLGIFFGVISAFSYVTENEWNQGQEMCKLNGGMQKFVAKPFENPEVTCVNGAYFTLKRGE